METVVAKSVMLAIDRTNVGCVHNTWFGRDLLCELWPAIYDARAYSFLPLESSPTSIAPPPRSIASRMTCATYTPSSWSAGTEYPLLLIEILVLFIWTLNHTSTE